MSEKRTRNELADKLEQIADEEHLSDDQYIGQLHEAAAALRDDAKDAVRYQWIVKHVEERLTDSSLIDNALEHKMQFVFPKLISWADFCGQLTLSEAIDYATEAALSEATPGEAK